MAAKTKVKTKDENTLEEEVSPYFSERSYINNPAFERELRQLAEGTTKVHNASALFLMAWVLSQTDGKTTDKFKLPGNYDVRSAMYSVKAYRDCADEGLPSGLLGDTVLATFDEFKSAKLARARYRRDKSGFTSGNIRLPKLTIGPGRYARMVFNGPFKQSKKGMKFADNEFLLPGTNIKCAFSPRLKLADIRTVTITYRNGKFRTNIAHKVDFKPCTLMQNGRVLGIDMGGENFIAGVFNNIDKSFLVKGGYIKSIFEYAGKKTAILQRKLKKQTGRDTSKAIERIYRKRDNDMDAYMDNCVQLVIATCLENDCGYIVVGRNKGWKQHGVMEHNGYGARGVNRRFVKVPHYKFIQKLKSKCMVEGIKVVEVKESYTSRTDHLAGEEMIWKPDKELLGSRETRGLFKSSTGKWLNADCNGAIGIMLVDGKLTPTQLGHMRDRGDIVCPEVLQVYPRKKESPAETVSSTL